MKYVESMFINLRLTVPLAISFFFGLCLQAQTPTYWLPTVERTPTTITYTYNLKAPDYFVGWLLQRSERGGGGTITKIIDGKTYTFVSQYFSWDTQGSSPARTGQIRLDDKNQRWTSNAWKDHANLKSDQTLIQALDSASSPFIPSEPWREADLLALRWDGADAPSLKYSENIPEITQIRIRLMSFSDGKTKAGAYFTAVKVPEDLDEVRRLMLAYGNLGRRDPNFRKNNGATTATDLSGTTVSTLKSSSESVNKDNPTPPYFKDHVLDPALNNAAQFQAEYQATQLRNGHDGPSRWSDPQIKEEKIEKIPVFNMATLGDRSLHFAGTYKVVEAAGGPGTIGQYPHSWMSGETHFRPWFNVDKLYPKIGYGVAKGSDGKWYFAAVPNWEDGPSSSPASQPVIQTQTGAQGTTSTANITPTTPPPTTPQPTTPPPTTPQPTSGYTFPLRAGTSVVQGQKYYSESGGHYLTFQPDGNVAMYTTANKHVWSLDLVTPKFAQTKDVQVQSDGNFVVYGPNKAYIWSALTKNPDPSGYLTLAPDGALRLVSGNTGATLWASDNNLAPVYGKAAGAGNVQTPGPTAPPKASPVTPQFETQYAIRQPDNTFRYFQNVRSRTQGYSFQACPQPSSSNEIKLYSLDTVMRVEDALAQGLKASGQPCTLPFGK